MRTTSSASAAILLTICFSSISSAVPSYSITTLGLTDAEHTRDDGYQNSLFTTQNELGQVVGDSERYNGGIAYLGQSAWFYDGFTTTKIGLTDIEHTRDDGYKYSDPTDLNAVGQIIGASRRFDAGSIDLGRSAWFYDGTTTINIGLTDSEHTHDDGTKISNVLQLNEDGQAAGHSERYNGSSPFGRTAWLYDGSTTTDIGLTDSEHTHSSGYQHSELAELPLSRHLRVLNEAGQVIGESDRWNGGTTHLGYTAWLFDGTDTTNIGLTDSEYTRSDGYKYSRVNALTESGHVLGFSDRYNGGSADLGESAWLYDGTTTINIGLTGSEHTRNDGYKSSSIGLSGTIGLNQAGQVIGHAARFNGGSTDLGQSAWLYDGTTTTNIGLTDSEHTRDDGYKSSSSIFLNEGGQAVGTSSRYNGGTQLGNSAWFYDGSTTINIGLTDDEHTRDDGYRSSVIAPPPPPPPPPFGGPTSLSLNEAGQVIGSSRRYDGGNTDLGTSAWIYDGISTSNIGLTDSEHTRDDGRKSSSPFRLNDAGQVMGFSDRYNGTSTNLGRTAWFFDGSTTINIGLIDNAHTRYDGYKISTPSSLNEAGQVVGSSSRYNGGSTVLGSDAWLYDPTLDQTIPFELSTRSDGYAQSIAQYLGEDGLVLGSYTLFDEFDNDLGQWAFYFTVEDGLHDLGSLVAGGLPVNGWDRLASAIRANGLGQVLGYGLLSSQPGGQMPYLLTPVPEPSTLLLTVLGCVVISFIPRHCRTCHNI